MLGGVIPIAEKGDVPTSWLVSDQVVTQTYLPDSVTPVLMWIPQITLRDTQVPLPHLTNSKALSPKESLGIHPTASIPAEVCVQLPCSGEGLGRVGESGCQPLCFFVGKAFERIM